MSGYRRIGADTLAQRDQLLGRLWVMPVHRRSSRNLERYHRAAHLIGADRIGVEEAADYRADCQFSPGTQRRETRISTMPTCWMRR